MCKLMAILEIENRVAAESFGRKAVRYMTENDNDGLGIMRLGENGTHIQRWVEVPMIPSQRTTLDRFRNVLERNENQEGRRSHDLYALAIHSRLATCGVNIENTHPFYRNNTALMHNGVIRNHQEFPKYLSSCDSEALLTQYIDGNVRRHPKLLTDALRDIQGYFACIVFNDNGVIDIWRDDSATLYMAHVRGVGVVVCTTQEIIMQTARIAKVKVTAINRIKPYSIIRWIKGKNPMLKRFTHEDIPRSIPSYQGNLFPSTPDVEMVGERGTIWQENADSINELADDYQMAKLRGFKGTIDDYQQKIFSGEME